MLSWMWPPADSEVQQPNDTSEVKPVIFPAAFKDLLLERGVTVDTPCGQTLVFSGNKDSSIFSMRICPVWKSQDKTMSHCIIQCKRMEYSVSRDRSLFTDWMERYGVTARFHDDTMVVLSFPPVRTKDVESGKWENTTTKLVVATHILLEPVKVFILGYNMAIKTTDVDENEGKVD